jgi:hypothetical protein
VPNAYASIAEIRAAVPDGIQTATTRYDTLLLRLSSEISRWIDKETKRRFYPLLATRRFSVRSLTTQLWVPDIVSITSVEYSNDDGLTYTAMASADYVATTAGDYNHIGSYTMLEIDRNGDFTYWPTGQRSIRIVGVWACVDDRAICWESTGDTVENNPLTAGGASLIVNDVDGLDIFGIFARFQGGQIYRIESEYVETSLVIDTTANTIGILRARNGTTAAAHLQNVAVDVWRVAEPVRQATIIQCLRQMERGFQAYGDARATPDVGQMFWFKALDPEARSKLEHYLNLEAH